MFFLYMIVVFFILLTMFVTIIIEAFSAVRDDISKQSNEHEMVDFIIMKFKQWTGINQLMAAIKKQRAMSGGEPNSLDRMTEKERLEAQLMQFPQRMDVFLDRISHSYFQKEAFENILFDNAATNKNSLKTLMQTGGKEKTPSSSYSKGQR